MSEHTTVCDCGMALAVHSSWIGRHIRCPHCRGEYLLQTNLTVLPPSEAAEAAFRAAAGSGGMAMIPSAPVPAAPPVDDGAELEITLSPPCGGAGGQSVTPGETLDVVPEPSAPQRRGLLPAPANAATPPTALQIEPSRWMPITVLLVGLLSLPAVFLWGIGSLICGATALVLGTEARRLPCRKPWMRTVGLLAGALGIILSVAYWLVAWRLLKG